MKFKTRADALRAKEACLTRGKSIAAKAEAEGRCLTAAERAEVNTCVSEAKAAGAAVAEFDGDRSLLDSLSGLSRPGGAGGSKGYSRGDGSWAKAMDTFLGRHGFKELVPSGQITVPALSSGIVTTEDRPRSILNLITFLPVGPTDQFSYLRQTVRDHNASTVRPGQRKPTSVYSLEKVDDRVRTVAHLSEPIDRSTLSDTELLMAYLEGALRDGVMLELEDQVLNGAGSVAGVLDDMTGILNTTGVQAQPFDTDRFVTARKAITILEDQHLDLGGAAWAMSPAEWEAFELATSATPFQLSDPGTPGQNLPVDRARKTLWGYPVVTTTAMADGSTLIGDWRGSVAIREREDVTLTWSDAVTVTVDEVAATAFERNMVVVRSEGRWGLAVMRPAAFVEADLAAGS